MANMTKRNIYTALAILVKNGALPEEVVISEGGGELTRVAVTPADFKAFAAHEVELLDKRNAHRASKETPKQKENAELATEIYDKYENGEKIWATKVVADFDGVTVNKVASILSRNEAYFKPLGQERVEKGKSKVNVYEVVKG